MDAILKKQALIAKKKKETEDEEAELAVMMLELAKQEKGKKKIVLKKIVLSQAKPKIQGIKLKPKVQLKKKTLEQLIYLGRKNLIPSSVLQIIKKEGLKLNKLDHKSKIINLLIKHQLIPKLQGIKLKPQSKHKIKHGKEIKDYVTTSNTHQKGEFEFMNNTIDFYPLTESTTPHIVQFIIQCIKKFQIYLKTIMKQGYNLLVNIKLSDDIGTIFSTIVLNQNESEQDMEVKLIQKANKLYPTTDYIMYIVKINLIASPLSTQGGCLDGNCRYKIETISKDKKMTFKIKSLKSTNNNCLFQCFNDFYGTNGLLTKPNSVRKDLKLPQGSMITYDQIPMISSYYNKKFKKTCGYSLMNENCEFISVGGNPTEFISLYLRNDHYYLFESTTYKKCKDCGTVLVSDNTTHVCNITSVSYHNTKIKKKGDMVKVFNIKDKEKTDYDKTMVPFDLETFQESNRHVPYACGWKYQGEYKVTYGKGCFEQAIDEFITYKNMTFTAYNGSSFDFSFLLDSLTARGVSVTNLIINNNRILGFKFGDGNTIFDICLFTICALSKACKDFKIQNAKGSLDHSLFQTWDDVEKHKEEVLPYLKLDVLALDELIRAFNDMFYGKFQVNIKKFITCSSNGYSLWASMLNDLVEIPKEMDKYEMICESIFGGRTTCNKMNFKSLTWENEIKPKLDQNLILPQEAYHQLKESGDFIYNADVSSLYPASMSGCKLMKAFYPTGYSRWSNDPQTEFNNKKIGFYKIKYICPKNIRVPILPKKKLIHGKCVGATWDLLDGSGTYTSVDIENAIEFGYEIEFIDNCLVYDAQSDNIFSEYNNIFFTMKKEAEESNNPVLRSIAKIYLNSLYGKTLQKAIYTKSTIINNAKEFNQFASEHFITDWKILNDSTKILVVGDSKVKEAQINKPSQIGAFVTAYSRRLMLIFMKTIDPTLQSMIFSYSDTDSLHIEGKYYKQLKELGLIKDKKDSEVGFLTNDIDNEGIITREINLAPKSYTYNYINNCGLIASGDCGVMKMKGIQKKNLKSEYYEKQVPVVLQNSGLKKKTTKLTKNDKQQGIGHFSVCNYKQDKTFYANKWNVDNFHDGQWYPTGYSHV